MIFDLLFDLIVNFLQWSGIFSIERKIEKKVKKIAKIRPEVEKFYINNQFEFDENKELINKLFSVDENSSEEIEDFIDYCRNLFQGSPQND